MARRIITAREQVEMLSPWREAAPIWQKIPADLDWGNDFEEQGEAPPLSYRQREETDQPTGKWYHVSTQPLEVGTKVVPKGGPSPDPDFYDDPNETGYNNSNRQNYVWLAPSLASAHSWSRDLGAPYIHEVKPGDKPQPWNFSGTNGWVSPHAHVVRQVSDDEARAASEEYYAGLRQKAHEEWLSQATPEEIEELTALSQQLSKPARVAVFDPMAVTNRLKGEFNNWFDNLPQHRLDEIKNIEMHPFMDHHEDNPVSHWPTVERFLKDKYPAAHRGFMNGQEDAAHWLDDPDNENESPMMENEDDWPDPYSSADHEKLGYDPQEIAAGMVLLHNRAHSGRQDSYLNTDKKRLVDIFNKRQQMQRNYEQRNARLKTAADLAKEYTQQLHDEFHDWAKGADWLEGSKPSDTPDYTKPMGGPLTYWGNIEKFFKDRYPEAYRGFNMAEEKARPLMDNGRATWSAETMRAKPYETGPEAEAKYGYDPKALAAGMMYLHTWSHAQSAQNAWRGDKLPRDIGRLNDIFQKRQQMQRNYEQNQAVTNAPH